jgi:hypothetical protein
MWRFFAGPLILLWGGIMLNGPVEALRLKTDWGERVKLSERIVRGKVTEVKSYWNPERTLIFTDVIIIVDEYLKGNGPGRLAITIPGGTVCDKTQWVSDTPQLKAGDYGVIFLEPSGQIIGGPDGVYLLEGEDSNSFVPWLRAYIAGDPKACKEGPPVKPME